MGLEEPKRCTDEVINVYYSKIYHCRRINK